MADVMTDAELDAFFNNPPETVGEELVRETAEEILEGLGEDKVPKGTSVAVFLAALSYAFAKKATGLGPFAALGADPTSWAKYVARGLYAGISALARNRSVPPWLYAWIRRMGPMTGGLKGVMDGLRRDTVRQLEAWGAISDPVAREAAMQPHLGVAEGLIELKWAKFSGRAAGLPASTSTSKGKGDGATVSNGPGLPGTGRAAYIRTYLSALEKAAVNDEARLHVQTLGFRLDIYVASSPEDGAYILDLSARGLYPPEEIVRILELPDTDLVPGEERASDGAIRLIPVRHARLNALAREARKRVTAARLEDGTDKPKEKVDDKGLPVKLGPPTIKILGREVRSPAHVGLAAAIEDAQQIVTLKPAARRVQEAYYEELREQDISKRNTWGEKLRRWLRREKE